MESVLTCFKCLKPFNLSKNSPRILPCNNSICLACIQTSSQPLSGYAIKCQCPQRSHLIQTLDEMYPSELITNYLTCQANNLTSLNNLKTQLERSRFSLNVAKFEASKHYDAMEMDIEIKAEMLINSVHEQREQLLSKMKELREKTDADFENINDQHNKNYSLLENSMSNIDTVMPINVNFIVSCFNKIQKSIEQVKRHLSYFNANTEVSDCKSLGVILQKPLELKYSKVKNLCTDLQNPNKSYKIQLESSNQESVLRRYTICMNRSMSVIIYFTTKKSITMELFGEHGQLVKHTLLEEDVKYYPIISNNTDNLLLSYISADNYTKIILLDSNLNIIKRAKCFNLIESIYMNKSNIVCTIANKKTNSCIIYDLQLNVLSSFGQQTNPSGPYYIEKIHQEHNDLKVKTRPLICGLTDKKIYIHNKSEMSVISRSDGNLISTQKKKSENSFLILDEQENITEIEPFYKEISFTNSFQDIQVESRYDLEASNIALIENNFFAFINNSKGTIKFI